MTANMSFDTNDFPSPFTKISKCWWAQIIKRPVTILYCIHMYTYNFTSSKTVKFHLQAHSFYRNMNSYQEFVFLFEERKKICLNDGTTNRKLEEKMQLPSYSTVMWVVVFFLFGRCTLWGDYFVGIEGYQKNATFMNWK